MGCQDKHLGNLDVSWSIGGKDRNIGNIITRQRLDAFIHVCSPVGVTMKSDVAEIRLNKSDAR